jgi:regulator of sigma E protease
METFLYGILTFLIVLGPLVILHEFGHFFTARLFGVKVLEYGFGFPPRAGGIWTGRAVIYLTPRTYFSAAMTDAKGEAATGAAEVGPFSDSELSNPVGSYDRMPKPGDIVTVRATKAADGRVEATIVRPKMAIDEDEQLGGQVFVGKVREIDGDRMVIADMLWSFNWLPLGGFVRLLGEEDPTAEGSLASKGRFARITVMAAGAAVNAVIPFILLPLILMVPQDTAVGDVVINSVFPGSPAAEAGIHRGDKVVRVDGRDIESNADLVSAVTLKLGAESTWEIMRGLPDPFARAGEPQYQYSGEIEKVKLTPRWKPPEKAVVVEVQDPEKELSIGEARIFDSAAGISNKLTVVDNVADSLHEISLVDARKINPIASASDVFTVVRDSAGPSAGFNITVTDARKLNFDLGVVLRIQEGATGVFINTTNVHLERRSEPFWTAFPNGARQAWDSIVLTRNAITGIAVGSRNPQFTETPTFTGPVGIGQLTGEIAAADETFLAKFTALASLAAVISFSLAILNILPIPALDGGRIFFVLIEIARGGKRISPEREGLVHLAGFIVLLAFIAVVSVQDIGRIFRGETFF